MQDRIRHPAHSVSVQTVKSMIALPYVAVKCESYPIPDTTARGV